MQLGLSGYDEKPRFWRSSANVYYKIHFFFEEFFFIGTRDICKKNKPTLDRFRGGEQAAGQVLLAQSLLYMSHQ